MASFTMKDIIENFDLKLKNTGNGKWYGECPFHVSKKSKNHTCFNVDEEKGYHCFSCGASGGPITFIKDYFNLNYLEAHKYILRHFGIKTDSYEKWENKIKEPFMKYLQSRCISENTAKHFKLSACIKGKYWNRIKIPIFNKKKLVGASYRTIDDREPRYLFQKGFKRSQFLYNIDSVKGNKGHILLVEGFFPVFKIYEELKKNAVASMGCNVSDKQLELLISKDIPIYIMFDCDKSGINASRKIQEKLNGRLETKLIELPENRQPDDLSKNDLINILKEYGI